MAEVQARWVLIWGAEFSLVAHTDSDVRNELFRNWLSSEKTTRFCLNKKRGT